MKNKQYFFIIFLTGLFSCSGFRPFDDTTAIRIIINDSSQLVMGKDAWTGPADCSSNAYLNKTPAGFLFTIEVFDDSIKTGNPASYLNDGVELYFDFRPPRLRERNAYEKGVFQAVILPEPGKKQLAPIDWYPQTYESAIPGTIAYTELRDSGYVLQVSIPYSGLGRYHYWPRKHFFVDVSINDADTGARESQLMWRGKNDNWNKPHNFESVRFEEEETRKPPKPNFLFIFTDQQTMKAMGAYGNPYVQTPNMDALAKFGVRFTRAYTTATICGPARSSIITGKMPHETGVNYNGQAVDSSIKNMGHYFRDEGYTTLWAGKWNLPETYPQLSAPEVPGFKLLQFSDGLPVSERGDFTDPLVADAAVKYLKGRKTEPFLLVVSFQNPHDITVIPGNMDVFRSPANIDAAPPLPANFGVMENEAEFVRNLRIRESYENEISLTTGFKTSEWRNYIYQYYRMTERVDREIGKLIAALEKEGLDENTIIILTSDHGDGSASHKWASSLSLYEETVKVPFIITSFRQMQTGRTDEDHLVSLLDILPTMMDYAGFDIPLGIRGRSLKAIVENPDTAWRDFVVTELAADPQDPSKKGRMIVSGNYKFVIYSGGSYSEQLFNLKTDPGEMRNLAAMDEYRAEKNILRKQLFDWMEETRDDFRELK